MPDIDEYSDARLVTSIARDSAPALADQVSRVRGELPDQERRAIGPACFEGRTARRVRGLQGVDA